jgi:hypothetical protein
MVGFKNGCEDGIILEVDGNSVGSMVGPTLGIKLDGKEEGDDIEIKAKEN